MTETPILEYLKSCTQGELAKSVGLHQTAISRMIRVKRPIFVITHDDGKVELVERKAEQKIAGANLQKTA